MVTGMVSGAVLVCRSVVAALWQTGFMHRITLGDFELTIFSDGTYPLDGGAFFGVIPKPMWARKVDADEKNYVTAGPNSLLIPPGRQSASCRTRRGHQFRGRKAQNFFQT